MTEALHPKLASTEASLGLESVGRPGDAFTPVDAAKSVNRRKAPLQKPVREFSLLLPRPEWTTKLNTFVFLLTQTPSPCHCQSHNDSNSQPNELAYIHQASPLKKHFTTDRELYEVQVFPPRL